MPKQHGENKASQMTPEDFRAFLMKSSLAKLKGFRFLDDFFFAYCMIRSRISPIFPNAGKQHSYFSCLQF